MLALLPFLAGAQQQVDDLLPYAQFLTDTSGTLTIDKVRNPGIRFAEVNKISSEYPTWMRLTMPATIPDGNYCLSLFMDFNSELYYIKDGQPEMVRNGASLPPSKRNVPENVRRLCFVYSQHEPVLFLKIAPVKADGIRVTRLQLEQQDDARHKDQITSAIAFFFSGGMLIMVLASLTLFFFLRDRSFVLFAVYLTFFYIMVNKLFLAALLGDVFPLLLLNRQINQLYFIITPLAFLVFAFSFFNLREGSKVWKVVFYGSRLLSLVCLSTIFTEYLSTSSHLILIYNVLSFVLVTVYAWVVFVKTRSRPALHFVAGMSIPLFIILLIVLNYIGVMPVAGLSLMANFSMLTFCAVLGMSVITRYQQVNRDFVSLTLSKLQQEHEAELFRVKNIELQSVNETIEEQKKKIEGQAIRLEELNGTKDNLLSILSHDLRGPVGNLRSILSLLSNKMLTHEEFQELSIKLKKDVESSYDMLDAVLQWVRSQREGIRPHPVKFNIMEVIETVLNLFSSQAMDKEISISLTAVTYIPVFADSDQVHIILRNLIGNAIKFAPDRSQITVAVSSSAGTVMISIQDQGMGISVESIGKIMQGARITSALGTHGEKGTGLGLMLCQEFIRHNAGSFLIESETGKFTKISFTLPAAVEG